MRLLMMIDGSKVYLYEEDAGELSPTTYQGDPFQKIETKETASEYWEWMEDVRAISGKNPMDICILAKEESPALAFLQEAVRPLPIFQNVAKPTAWKESDIRKYLKSTVCKSDVVSFDEKQKILTTEDGNRWKVCGLYEDFAIAADYTAKAAEKKAKEEAAKAREKAAKEREEAAKKAREKAEADESQKKEEVSSASSQKTETVYVKKKASSKDISASKPAPQKTSESFTRPGKEKMPQDGKERELTAEERIRFVKESAKDYVYDVSDK